MRLTEMWEKLPGSYQDISDDNSRTKLHQLRKTRLTLKQLTKLRLMNDIRNAERLEKLQFVRRMYQPPAQG